MAGDMSQHESVSDEGGGELPMMPACPHCLGLNEPTANFCTMCGSSIGQLAVGGPVEQVLTQGQAYRKAIDNQPSKLLTLGLWLIFGPNVAINLIAIIARASQLHFNLFDASQSNRPARSEGEMSFQLQSATFQTPFSLSDLLGFCLVLGLLGLQILLLSKVTLAYFKKRKASQSQA